LFGFIMAEILQKAFQNAIDEQGKMEDKNSQKAPAIDSVIVTGPDIIQLLKTGEKEVATDEGADPVQASSPEFNPNLTQSSMNDAGTNIAITAKEANERAPDEKAESVKAAPPESLVRTMLPPKRLQQRRRLRHQTRARVLSSLPQQN
jgi:hypothetical protein